MGQHRRPTHRYDPVMSATVRAAVRRLSQPGLWHSPSAQTLYEAIRAGGNPNLKLERRHPDRARPRHLSLGEWLLATYPEPTQANDSPAIEDLIEAMRQQGYVWRVADQWVERAIVERSSLAMAQALLTAGCPLAGRGFGHGLGQALVGATDQTRAPAVWDQLRSHPVGGLMLAEPSRDQRSAWHRLASSASWSQNGQELVDRWWDRLLVLDLDVNAKDSSGETPFLQAPWFLREPLRSIGANLHARSHAGLSAWHMDTFQDRLSVEPARQLVAWNLDINAPDHTGATPLHALAERMVQIGHENHQETVIQLLTVMLEAGANPELQDGLGRSARSLWTDDLVAREIWELMELHRAVQQPTHATARARL